MFQQFLLWGFFAERRNHGVAESLVGVTVRAHDLRVSGMWMKKCEIIKGGAAQQHYHHGGPQPVPDQVCIFVFSGGQMGMLIPIFWETHSDNSSLCFKTCLRLTRTVRTVWLSNFEALTTGIMGTFLTPIHPHIVHIVGSRIHHIPICLHIKRLDYIIYIIAIKRCRAGRNSQRISMIFFCMTFMTRLRCTDFLVVMTC